MKWLGDKPFHTFLLLTEVPARWPAWQIAPISALLAASAGWIWSSAVDPSLLRGAGGLGWAVALSLLLFALADWALLATLPRRGISFGPVQPPWLGLVVARWVLALVAVPFASRWPLPAFTVQILLQTLIWALAAYGTLLEPFRLRVTRLELNSAKLANPGRPLRIVQLSDLHVERLTRRERALPALVAGLSPDLIVLTGDFLSTSYNEDGRALVALRELLGQLYAPGGIYAVWGTVEVDDPHLLQPVLAGLGVTILNDRAAEVEVHGQRLWLMGLYPSGDPEAEAPILRELLAAGPTEAFTLLLYHAPDLMPQASKLGVDLMLAGHTHGGQWRLPGFGAILTGSRYWKRYEAGHYVERNTHLYVSRGLGLEGFGAPRARFFCPPEVVMVTLSGVSHRPGSAGGRH
jgi:predicted MPP superfamily phosphohydrolase